MSKRKDPLKELIELNKRPIVGYSVVATGARGSSYSAETKNVNELLGALATTTQSLLNPCFEEEITIKVKVVRGK